MKVLVIDPDRDLVEMLISWLKTRGYDMYRAYSGHQAERLWEEQQPDVVLVDTAVKDVDALAMCRKMRSHADALVLALSENSDVHHEVACLESGADDYLRKPFFPAQLLAHLHALSRRGRSSLAQRPSTLITLGPLVIDALHHTMSIEGATTHLTTTESKLLHFLAVNVNTVCPLSQIVAHIWGFGNEGDAGLIKAHIRHLRQKIEADPSDPRLIRTVAGVGYCLTHPLSNEEA